MENVEFVEFLLEPGVIKSDTAPFKEIINGEDVSKYVLSLQDKRIELKDIFRLKINVKKVGTIFYLFPLEGFNRNQIVKDITPLKEMEVIDSDSALAKVNKVIEITKNYNPVAAIYLPDKDVLLDINTFLSLGWEVPVFYIEEPKVDFTEVSLEENKKPKEKKVRVKGEKRSFKVWIKDTWEIVVEFFEPMKRNGFYYLFTTIAALLVGFTTSIGMYDCYAGNMILIFFFICALVGGVLGYFVLFDFFKTNKLNTKDFYFDIFFAVLGASLSLLAFLLFYSLQKEKPESLTNVGVIYGVTFVISIVVMGISGTLGYIIRHKKSK